MTLWDERAIDFRRHIADLRERGYEGATERADRDAVFGRSVRLTSPVAVDVLEQLNRHLLEGSGRILTEGPIGDGDGGLRASWSLTWPLLETARDRFTGAPLPPVTIGAIFPAEWTHGHLAARSHAGLKGLIAWPLQVIDERDAIRQQSILCAIAEAELHDRIFEADVNWRIMPTSA